MNNDLFTAADILIPSFISPLWSVVACDQYSSEPDYWTRVADRIGDNPSTLGMIIPEAYLSNESEDEQAKRICSNMKQYFNSGLFKKVPDSLVYLERTLENGLIRRGLIGALDLEEYDFTGKDAAVLASEGTVLDRLPARVRVRRQALLEVPHIIAFIDDKDDMVLSPLSEKSDIFPVLYDFKLMENGGHVRGMQVAGTAARKTINALNALREPDRPLMIMGDGNHSLAAAKLYWDELKQSLSESECEIHPARRALLEINNVYDSAVSFEAIHRVVFNTNPEKLIQELENALPKGGRYSITWHAGGKSGVITSGAACIGDMLGAMQDCLDAHVEKHSCGIDYIHGADKARALSEKPDTLALILPAMGKGDFFDTVITRGVFPRKSFSVGNACDKRFYLECRKIC